jgi:hypothetical protein
MVDTQTFEMERHAVVGAGVELVPASSGERVCPPNASMPAQARPPILPAHRESKLGLRRPPFPQTAINIRKLRTSGERGVPAETA